jgi:hypothetical protein
MDADMAAEGFTRLTYEISERDGGLTRLTVVHELEGAPRLAALMAGEMEDRGAGGGWSFVLSGPKTLLEAGDSIVHERHRAPHARSRPAPAGPRPARARATR